MSTPLLPRREFLKYSALLPSIPWLSSLGDLASTRAPRGDRILVIVELNGGNDGVNTVVPFRDEGYGRHRTVLRLPDEKLLKLDGQLGLHPSLRGMGALWERSELAIVQGVGYPDPNLSHDVSLAVWHTGRLDRVERQGYGWIGRTLDAELERDGKGRRAPRALLAGPHALTRALRARKTPVATVPDIATYLDAGDIGTDKLLDAEAGSEMAEHVRTVLADAGATARSLAALENDKQDRTPYPTSRLATELGLISRLIRGGFDTSVYYAIQNGFDTHSLQPTTHANLMQELGDALLAFVDDMRGSGRGKHVLVLVFSEFGRRVQENASQGTDHGTAGPVFLAGAPVRPGIHGVTPSLLDLDDGNLKTTVDFRRVYASVLRDWMQVDPTVILGACFEPLPLL
ncbi:MAG TPA: DUF1501 domain-containing protein [Planctomycetota bacterium]|nr:DUF1501 domain-containing protein [Planctomycetota bacterium]